MSGTAELARWIGPSRPREAGGLADREAIRQLPMIYALGVDMRDFDLAFSAFSADAFVDGNFGQAPVREYLDRVLTNNAVFAATQHHITNQYVSMDGGEALIWSYVVAYHIRPEASGEDDIIVGTQYRDSCRYDQGAWVIVRRKSEMQWTRGR